MSKRFKHRDKTKPVPQTNRQPAYRPYRLPLDASVRLIRVFVEGYEDVAFWRGIFDAYETDYLMFEISVPPRPDLAKGKKVLLQMAEYSSPDLLLCMDSDFDYLFDGQTEQSRTINSAPYFFHTYAYATENYLCCASSLHNVCVKATKNDTRIFDFELFMREYSQTIYPLFLWYAYSAQQSSESVFTLIDFKSSVKLNYLEVDQNGSGTLEWLKRQVDKRLVTLKEHHPYWDGRMAEFGKMLSGRGVTPQNVYLFMQGHTLMDNVVIVALHAVCEHLKTMTNEKITTSQKSGIALRNELSNYNNSLRSVRDILLDNENYKDCFLYQKLKADIEAYISALNKA